jgi:DNA-binding NarL/FixJ family response regulator
MAMRWDPDHARVVIVDDSRELLRSAATFLRARGLQVVGTFEDARTALATAPTLDPDVAVIDLRMTGITGLEAIGRFREALPLLGIVVLTLVVAGGYRRLAFAAGADEYVDKARFDTDLIPAIGRAARARRPQEIPR